MHSCRLCKSEFEITAKDAEQYRRFEVPVPQLCFQCRLQRRLAFFNRRNIYRRKCDYSGKQILSTYSPDKPLKVYDKDIWCSDQWDPLQYGREVDFNRPFFEQFAELLREVPHQSLSVLGGTTQNSEYVNDCGHVKDCYLVFDCAHAEGVLYSEGFVELKSCVDILGGSKLELCYDCVNCHNCYNLKFSVFCQGCSDSFFLHDCIGCRHCFGCVNLRNKQYFIFNEAHSAEEYQAFLKNFRSESFTALEAMKARAEDWFKQQPCRALRNTNVNESEGNFLVNCSGARQCFNCRDLEDCSYCTDLHMLSKDCMDCHSGGDRAELVFNTAMMGEELYNTTCSFWVGRGSSNLAYCFNCIGSNHDLVGCIGLKRASHCIMNRALTKHEYDTLREKLVTHMRATGEWGEFFPPPLSPFGYNESLAAPLFPLSKEQAKQAGWSWCDYEAEAQAVETVSAGDLPNSISDVRDSIIHTPVRCAVTGRPFRVVMPELLFYRQQRLPLPRVHPDVRHARRVPFRTSLSLQPAKCKSCQVNIMRAVPPPGFENVVCERCYENSLI